jgi:hypothetical protein
MNLFRGKNICGVKIERINYIILMALKSIVDCSFQLRLCKIQISFMSFHYFKSYESILQYLVKLFGNRKRPRIYLLLMIKTSLTRYLPKVALSKKD